MKPPVSRFKSWARQKFQRLARGGVDHPVPRIAPATRFFRNRPLMDEVFDLMTASGRSRWQLFFHACSTGEEPYSFAMANLLGPRLALSIEAADYNPHLLAQARAGRYDWLTLWRDNKGFMSRRERSQFQLRWLHGQVCANVRRAIARWHLLDYTDPGCHFEVNLPADVVFCNSSLLYHPPEVQAVVLARLCRQASEMLVVTGVDNTVLETVLPAHGFVPHGRNWEAIYDGCRLRRRAQDGHYNTPTTPFLSDANRAKVHHFRYAIFVKANGVLANPVQGDPPCS